MALCQKKESSYVQTPIGSINYSPKGCFALIGRFLNDVATVEDFCFYSVGSRGQEGWRCCMELG